VQLDFTAGALSASGTKARIPHLGRLRLLARLDETGSGLGPKGEGVFGRFVSKGQFSARLSKREFDLRQNQLKEAI
jgi:hypothetical protein